MVRLDNYSTDMLYYKCGYQRINYADHTYYPININCFPITCCRLLPDLDTKISRGQFQLMESKIFSFAFVASYFSRHFEEIMLLKSDKTISYCGVDTSPASPV